MKLYDDIYNTMIKSGVSERVAHDILNPMLYNPMEYVRGVGGTKFKDNSVADIVL